MALQGLAQGFTDDLSILTLLSSNQQGLQGIIVQTVTQTTSAKDLSTKATKKPDNQTPQHKHHREVHLNADLDYPTHSAGP